MFVILFVTIVCSVYKSSSDKLLTSPIMDDGVATAAASRVNFDPDRVDGVEPLDYGDEMTEARYMKITDKDLSKDDIDVFGFNSSDDYRAFAEEDPISSASKTRFLRVHRQLVNLTKVVGENVKMRCEVEAYPPPRFKWFKNEAPVREEKPRLTVRRFNLGSNRFGSRLKINDVDILDTGYYRCQAHSGGNEVKTTGVLVVKLGRGEPPGTIPSYAPVFPQVPDGDSKDGHGMSPEGDLSGLSGKCLTYKGRGCSSFVGNQSVFIRPPKTIDNLDRQIITSFTVLWNNKDISHSCEKYAIRLMCYHSFPLCGAGISGPRSICRSECFKLQDKICKDEYVMAKQNNLIGRNNIIPDCNDLPQDGSRDAAGCIRLGMAIVDDNTGDDCYVDRGEEYHGTVSRTVSGKDCLPWSSKLQDKLSIKYPELVGHNHCRNPGGQEKQPWCYTTDELIPVEVCDVQECGSFLWMYVAIPCVGVLVLIGLLCAICCIRRRSLRQSTTPPAKLPTDYPTTTGQNYNLPAYSGRDVEMNPIWQKNLGPVRVRQIPPSTVSYIEELGEGSFGSVYRGEVSALNMDRSITPVVIKTLKTGASTQMFQIFRQEVEVMTDLKHPSIVSLLAVCVRDQPFCMLFEYPTGGNLHEYLLRSARSISTASDQSRSYCQSGLDVGEFLCIATQIASGMEYLSSQHYVHRDVAARNCLLSDNLNVKISNFGLARDTYACDYYYSSNNGLLPIRWMPAEAILYGRFSTESDIWSFGILLWEMLSHGRQPYYGYSNQEVIDMISSHQLLPCPDDSSTQVYGLMLECWSDVAAKRPSFQELHLRLHSWQVLHNMGNLNSSQFFRQHSDSQHSSTGPSNRTGSTHVSSIIAPSSRSLHNSSTHSGISSQPVTVIGLDHSITSSKTPVARSNSPSTSSTAGLTSTQGTEHKTLEN